MNLEKFKKSTISKRNQSIYLSESKWEKGEEMGYRSWYVKVDEMGYVNLIPQYEDSEFEFFDELPSEEHFKEVRCVDGQEITNKTITDIRIIEFTYSFGFVLDFKDKNLILCLDTWNGEELVLYLYTESSISDMT